MARENYRNGDPVSLPGHNCESCDVISINNRVCHEKGCPNSWKDYEKECFSCGTEFFPSERYEMLCQDCKEERSL